MKNTESGQKHQTDWFSKTLAGLTAGLAIAFVCVGFYVWYGPGTLPDGDKTQFAMWLVTPIWLLILASVYLFSSGKRAWTVLISVGVLLYSSFFLLRSLA